MRTRSHTLKLLKASKANYSKAKLPPKKSKEDQVWSRGQPCLITYYRVENFKLWHVRTLDDKLDAFMKIIVDELRSDPDSYLRDRYGFRCDVTRRISVDVNEPLKNPRKGFERKFLLQVVDENSLEDELKTDLATAKIIFQVRRMLFHIGHMFFI